MKRLATVSALLLLAGFLMPVGTEAAPYCANTGTSLDCNKDKTCKCSDIMVGDPVNLADGSSFHRVEDFSLGRGVSQDLAFLRTYDSEDLASSHAGELTGVPKPFGSSPTSLIALKWSYNFFAFVFKPTSTSSNWWVRNLDGRRMEFKPCGFYGCFAANSDGNKSRPHRLQWNVDGFTLYESDGRKLHFHAAFGTTHYFLTEVVSPQGVSEVQLTYSLPTGCPGGYAAPYLSTLVTSRGLQLSFTFKALTRLYNPGTECVISKITVSSAGSIVPDRQVEYSYTKDSNGVERPGLIEAASWTGLSDSRSENYNYDSGFGVHKGGFWIMRHTDTGTDTLTQSLQDSYRIVWSSTAPACHPNSACCTGNLQERDVWETVFDGGGNTSVGDMLRRYDLISSIGFTGGRLYRRTDSCTPANSCSAGDMRYEWECPGSNGSGNNGSYPLYAEKGVKNKRDFWTVYTNALPPPAQPQELTERTAIRRGASSLAGSDALEVHQMTYVYPLSGEQRLATESVRSVLDTTGSENAVTTHRYDSQGVKLATYQRGWTRDLNGIRVPRVVATFYSESRLPWACGDGAQDAQGRMLTVAGPCEVTDETAQQCSGTNFPVKLSYYWQGETAFNRNSNLKKEVVYPNGCTSTPLEVTYDKYDGSGNATRIVSPDGVATEYVFGVNGMLSSSVGSAPPTTYGYDNGALAWIRFPQGNYEVYCHRRNTGAACTGGQWHPRVQWKAKSSTQDGATWSEKVLYAYWGSSAYPNEVGPLMSETFLSATGEVRQIKKYAVDGQERSTRTSWGNIPSTYLSYYTTPYSYDGADNMTGVGHPYNSAPAWCGGVSNSQTGMPLSRRCDALQYDRADRLESLVEYTSDNTSVAGIKTCFVHDRQGHIKTVVSQCQTTEACTLADGSLNPALPSACVSQAIDYQYDDFGHLVEFVSPAGNDGDNGRGRTRYTYNGAGNQTAEQTESMRAAGARVEYTSDQLGRRKIASYWDGTSWKTMYQFFYDGDGGNPPTGCSAPTYTQGRLRMTRDSGGDTWYSYDSQGRLVNELRVRPGATSCSETHSEANPHISYTYTDNGNLSSITYPHGRRIEYAYPTDLNRVDLVDSISVALYSGTPAAWTQKTLVSNVAWEPYGGLRGYHLEFPTTGTTASLEYLLGDKADTPPSSGCPSTMPSQTSTDPSQPSMDWTGRLRALWLTSGAQSLGTGTGDIYKRTYTWQADQVARIDTCVRNAASQQEQFAYDRLLRLTSATMPSATTTGGAYQAYSPSYDDTARGNRSGLVIDGLNNGLTYTYSGDQLSSYTSNLPNTRIQRSYGHDRDGRVIQLQWPVDSSGQPGRMLNFTYSTDEGSAGNTMVFRTVQVGSVYYNYWYDAQGRRRLKVHPTDQTEEYFYDQRKQMLEDRGFASLTQNAPYPLDEYVWLGGQPVVMLRSSFDAAWNRQPDSEAVCQRLGLNEHCGVYFIVSDHIGKPVLMMDGSGRITGMGEYSPFGTVNRVEAWGETQHPYINPTAEMELARISQPTLGLSLDVRLRFDMMDTEACLTTPSYYDPTYVVDGTTHAPVAGPFGGHHQGPYVTPWFNNPGTHPLAVTFWADQINWAPNGTGCLTVTNVNFPYSGVALRAYDYRRYDGAQGASPMWTPLRFPGQYHDAETDLFENWNRYYDPSTGRYLQPEPLLESAEYLQGMAKGGLSSPAYVYANSNPLAFADENGLKVSGTADRNDWWNILQDVLWDLSSSQAVHDWFMGCFGADPFTDALEHNIHAPREDWWCNFVNAKATTNGFTGDTTLCRGPNFDHPLAGPPGTQRREIAATIMHELAHQMGPIKTNDSLSYCGGSGPVGTCSAQEAERIGHEAIR